MKKIFKIVTFLTLIMIIGGTGAIIAERYFFPYLTTTKFFSKYEFLRKGIENTTVINKTEQIYIKEETTLSKITSKINPSIVNILIIEDYDSKQPVLKNTTGVVVTSDGLIVTYDNSFFKDGSSYKIYTYDSNSYSAKLFGIDSFSNLVFLKADTNNLQPVSFGNSNDSRPGDKIIIISNNFGFYSNQYASGLIRANDQKFNLAGLALSSSEKMEGVFSLDINSGEFSGAAVVDYSGQVIGIVGFVIKDNKEIYFQIPSNKVKWSMERAIRNELDNNPYLGIYYLPIDKSLASAFKLPVEKGALIYSASGQQGLAIIANSPAQKAGLRINDIIIKVDDQEVNLENPFSEIIRRYKKGEVINLRIIRNNKEESIKVSL